MKQQKWEWLLALKRPTIWLIPLVMTMLFLMPMLRGRWWPEALPLPSCATMPSP